MAAMINKGEAEASMTVRIVKADGSEQHVESVELDTAMTEEDFSKLNTLMNRHDTLKKELKELENEISNILRGVT
jgi:uncharacterized protein (DUF342 family)